MSTQSRTNEVGVHKTSLLVFVPRSSRTSMPVSEKLRLLFADSAPLAAAVVFFLGRVGRVSPSMKTSPGRLKLGTVSVNSRSAFHWCYVLPDVLDAYGMEVLIVVIPCLAIAVVILDRY